MIVPEYAIANGRESSNVAEMVAILVLCGARLLTDFEMDDIYVLFSENLRRRDPLKKNIPFLYSSWSLFPNQHTLIWEHLLLDINKSG
jgi:hypothetical protein